MTQPFSFEWFNETGDLAQWLIVAVLFVSAIFILWQVREQTHARKGENFFKVTQKLDEDIFRKSRDILYEYSSSKDGKKRSLLNLADSEIPPEILEHVSRVRETYESVGLMIFVGMIDRLDFLLRYSKYVRDIREILKENMKKTAKERNKDKTKKERYFEFFNYLGKMSTFWTGVTEFERQCFIQFAFPLPEPEDTLFRIRNYFIKKSQTK